MKDAIYVFGINPMTQKCCEKSTTQSWQERFRKEISIGDNLRYGDRYGDYNKIIDYFKSDKNILFRNEWYPENAYELDPDKVETFIQQILDEKEKEVRSEIREKIIEIDKEIGYKCMSGKININETAPVGYSQAIKDILEKL